MRNAGHLFGGTGPVDNNRAAPNALSDRGGTPTVVTDGRTEDFPMAEPTSITELVNRHRGGDGDVASEIFACYAHRLRVDQIEVLLRGLPPLAWQVLERRLQGQSVTEIASELSFARQAVYRTLALLQQRLARS